MKYIPVALSTLLYIWQALWFYYTKDYGGSLMFAGYALANIGIIMAVGH